MALEGKPQASRLFGSHPHYCSCFHITSMVGPRFGRRLGFAISDNIRLRIYFGVRCICFRRGSNRYRTVRTEADLLKPDRDRMLPLQFFDFWMVALHPLPLAAGLGGARIGIGDNDGSSPTSCHYCGSSCFTDRWSGKITAMHPDLFFPPLQGYPQLTICRRLCKLQDGIIY